MTSRCAPTALPRKTCAGCGKIYRPNGRTPEGNRCARPAGPSTPPPADRAPHAAPWGDASTSACAPHAPPPDRCPHRHGRQGPCRACPGCGGHAATAATRRPVMGMQDPGRRAIFEALAGGTGPDTHEILEPLHPGPHRGQHPRRAGRRRRPADPGRTARQPGEVAHQGNRPRRGPGRAMAPSRLREPAAPAPVPPTPRRASRSPAGRPTMSGSKSAMSYGFRSRYTTTEATSPGARRTTSTPGSTGGPALRTSVRAFFSGPAGAGTPGR